MTGRPQESSDEEFIALWNAGTSIRGIARAIGSHQRAVVSRSEALGLPRRQPAPHPNTQHLPVSEAEFVALWEAGHTLPTLAKMLGMTSHGVQRVAKNLGLRRKVGRLMDRLPEIRGEFTAMWGDPHYSTRRIGDHFGVTEDTAQEWAKALDLPHKLDAEMDYEGPHPGDPTEEEIAALKAFLLARRIMAGDDLPAGAILEAAGA